jgi:ATP-dependent DNA helicase RecG
MIGEGISKEVKFIKGVGQKRSDLLLKLGVETADDLLWLIPRRYEDRRQFKKISEIQDGETAYFAAKIIAPPNSRRANALLFSTVQISDGESVAGRYFLTVPTRSKP